MKKANLFYVLMAVMTLVSLTFTGCKDDEEEEENPVTEETLSGDITADKTLSASKTYYIDGAVHVKTGATLTIEPGTEIIAHSDAISYLLIEKGAKIMAEGTAAKPIVFTADTKESGAWGSLHICGDAPINVEGGAGSSEIGEAPYGGNNAADNSGVVKYCRFEYTGTALDAEHESNGLSLYGVGSGTTLEYIQIYEGNDDGIEFFGGTVNIKYVYVYGAGDDSFDWTEGWSGKGQYMLAEQKAGKGDRGIEGDNNGNNNQATPYANPTLSQVTLIGGGDADGYGMKLREGTKGNINNIIVTGFAKRTIHFEHDQTLNNINDGSLNVDYAYLNDQVSDMVVKYSESEGSADIEIDAAKKVEDKSTVTVTTVASDKTATYTGGTQATGIDSWFSADDKIGSGFDWASGWTK